MILCLVACRQDQQLGAVADRVEVEKRHMLMQLFDLSREEVRCLIPFLLNLDMKWWVVV